MAIVFDRSVVETLFSANSDRAFYVACGVFWLIILATFIALYWRRIRVNFSWYSLYLSVGFVALNVWFFWDAALPGTDTANATFGLTAIPVSMILAMLLATQTLNRTPLRRPGVSAKEVIKGWFVRPFNRISRLRFLNLQRVPKNSAIAVRVGIGVLASAILLGVLVPLLSSADQVFGTAVRSVFSAESFSNAAPHFAIVIVLTPLLFSLLWNFATSPQPAADTVHTMDAPDSDPVAPAATVGVGKSSAFRVRRGDDVLIPCIVLGVLIVTYAIFCAFQITFLFVGKGLPEGYTYSEYARQGFWQLLVVEAINLAVFGLIVTYAKSTRLVAVLQCALLALTGVILFSAFVRLHLYIAAYGLTWLRLISMVFIGYLAVILILALARVFTVKIPLIAVGVAIGLAVYLVLGYSNPDALISGYNIAHGMDVVRGMP
jgi:hypothetical protein